MHSEGLSPDAITYSCILSACGITQDIGMGKQVHDEIVSQGLLERNVILGNALVDMYVKCGVLTRAQKVLEKLSAQDVISWNALIAGYVQQEKGQQALSCFQWMQSEGLSPDAITSACIVKACSITRQVHRGKQIHDEIAAQGLLEKNVVLGTTLVDMYAKCGALSKSRKLLDELPVRDVVSWNAIITGYAQQGQGQEALVCFQQMQSEGLSPNAITYACILKACGITLQVDIGKQIHNDIISEELLETDPVLGTALVDMYAKCGMLERAQEVLDEILTRDIIARSALIAGYAQQGWGEEALGCFQQMRREGISPDAITYASVLKACGITQQADIGQQVHDEIVSQGLLEKSIVLGNALADMYVKCDAFTKAQEVLNEFCVRSVVSWNTLIAGYVYLGHGKEALDCFQQMQTDGFSPDAVTYACLLKACGIIQQFHRGKEIHNKIVSEGLLERDVVLFTALIDMYAKCGVLTKAQKVLDELYLRNVFAWNALIAGYAQHKQGEEALACFQRMQTEGISPDEVTHACTLKACGITQQAGIGEQIHDEIVCQGLLKRNVVLGIALLDMYAKCGVLTKAQNVFEGLPLQDIVSWNALIAGYAQQGRGKEALGCFRQMQSEGFFPDVVSWNSLIRGYAQGGLAEKALDCFQCMQQEGISPNATTFVHVLNACNRSRLVNEGHFHFQNMTKIYNITPEKEHYACMVNLFGNARYFNKAMRVIKMMPSCEFSPVWSALLGACQIWGNVNLGRFIFEHAIRLDGYSSAVYVSMANLYAAAGMQENAQILSA